MAKHQGYHADRDLCDQTNKRHLHYNGKSIAKAYLRWLVKRDVWCPTSSASPLNK